MISGMFGSSAAKRAAREQAAAIQAGIDFQNKVYDQGSQNLNPYIKGGQQALGTYQDMLGNYKAPTLNYQQSEFEYDKYKDPGAVYAAKQSGQALAANALAAGATGGGALKALQSNQNNLALNNYQNARNSWMDTSKMMYGQANDQYNRDYGNMNNQLDRYSNLATGGQNAAGALMGYGNTAAANMGQMYGAYGNAQAAGTVGANNAFFTGLGGVVDNLSKGLGAYYGYGNKAGVS